MALPYADSPPRPVRMEPLQLVGLGSDRVPFALLPTAFLIATLILSGGCGMAETPGDFSKFPGGFAQRRARDSVGGERKTDDHGPDKWVETRAGQGIELQS